MEENHYSWFTSTAGYVIEPTDSASRARLRPGLLSNYAGFALVAVTGLGLNVVIVGASGARALGLFSQTYVAFVIVAQIATFGLHYAVLRMVSHRPRSEAAALLRTGLSNVLMISVVVTAVTIAAAPMLASAFDSPLLERSITLAALGLPLHAANKVAIAYTNAVEAMHRFALYQSVRALGLLGAAVAISTMRDAPEWLGLVFPISEGLLALVIAATYPRIARVEAGAGSTAMLAFGWRSMPGGLVQETSARIDVIVLAVLVSDAEVGIFTIAATVVEGSYQLLVVLRNNLNPLISASIARGDASKLGAVARRLRRRLVGIAAICWVGVVVTARPLIEQIGASDDLERAYWPLVIMLGCLGLASPLLPFDQILLVGGRPFAQSVLMMAVLTGNVTGNLALVPVFGLNGAAIATGASFLGMAAGTWYGARCLLGVDLVRTDND